MIFDMRAVDVVVWIVVSLLLAILFDQHQTCVFANQTSTAATNAANATTAVNATAATNATDGSPSAARRLETPSRSAFPLLLPVLVVLLLR